MKKCVPALFLLLVKTASASSPRNLALGGEATQINTFNNFGEASHAIDGNRDSVYQRKSCSRTYKSTDPWWRVDLRDNYVITHITIVNRGDCCRDRLDGAQIRVGNYLDKNNGNDNPIVANISHISTLETFPMPGRVEGRYVNVFQPGTSKYLTLCEVEIYGFKANVALRGKATQIDTYNELGAASNAIDGNRDSIYYSNSCSHTFTTTNPWWRVDLGDIHVITSITIVNRGDCCQERLDGAEIRVGNSLRNNGNDNSMVARISHIRSSQTFTMSQPVEGRYVNVFLPGADKYLTLCEVEIRGFRAKVNLARRGRATQIDTFDGLGAASNAIDGKPESTNYDDSSCSHTFTIIEPWWRLDLLKTYVISSIIITNRGDCCANRLEYADLRVGNSLVNNGNDNPFVDWLWEILEGQSKTFTFSEPLIARYVNVFQQTIEKHLTLCEVEVYGYEVEPVNLALGGEAAQSDVNEFGPASHAIDGNPNSPNSCIQTITSTNPWWRVDLRDTYIITSVTVTNRGDCCHENINGAEIRVGNSLHNNGNDNPLMATIPRIPKGISETFSPPEQAEGRYVSVFLPGTGKQLTFCEVEVYGYKKDVNLALGGEAAQSDADEFGPASHAIDGNRNSTNSCIQTITSTNPWWRVDLRDTYIITSVTVTSRGDCCHNSVKGAEIRVGNSLHNNGNDNPLMVTIPRMPKGISETFSPPEQAEGRYVNVFLPGTGKQLTFCEVEVYGYKKNDAET